MTTVHLEQAPVPSKPILRALLSDYLIELAALEGVAVQKDDDRYACYGWFDDYWLEPDRLPFLIKIGDEIVGFCLLRDIGERWHVAEFLILPACRHKGIGSEAVEELKAFCRASGRHRHLEAPTHRWNHMGTLFWRSQGFVTIGEQAGLSINVCDLGG